MKEIKESIQKLGVGWVVVAKQDLGGNEGETQGAALPKSNPETSPKVPPRGLPRTPAASYLL